jgi:CRP-like cAMP-binding protein
MQMLSSNPGLPLDNKLLSWLPRQQMDLLVPHMTTKLLPQGTELLEAGEEFDHVYFPHRGMLSLLVVLDDCKAVEVATVGREGVVGAMAGLGLYKSSVRVVVQLQMAATMITASQFRKAVDNSAVVRDLCIRYNEVLLNQARVTAACNLLHPIESRFCRWLLQSADRAESDTVELTQEFLFPRYLGCAAHRFPTLRATYKCLAASPIPGASSRSSIALHWRDFPASAIER